MPHSTLALVESIAAARWMKVQLNGKEFVNVNLNVVHSGKNQNGMGIPDINNVMWELKDDLS